MLFRGRRLRSNLAVDENGDEFNDAAGLLTVWTGLLVGGVPGEGVGSIERPVDIGYPDFADPATLFLGVGRPQGNRTFKQPGTR